MMVSFVISMRDTKPFFMICVEDSKSVFESASKIFRNNNIVPQALFSVNIFFINLFANRYKSNHFL